MFKSRWRGGGGKAKAVFKLQFHATQARLRRPEAELRIFNFVVD
jgi:hypothetical protein